jgi:hypothetical protein
MDFLIKMPVSRSEISSVAGLLGGSLPAGDDILIGVNITGPVTDPKLSLSTEELSNVVKDEVRKEAEKLGDEVVKEAEKKLDELLKDEGTKEKLEEAGKKLKDLFK